MATNLIDSITSYITPDVISKASSFLGENPAATSRAMSGIVPTLLSSLTNMASQPSGATQLAGLLSSGGHDGSVLNNLAGLFAGGSATSTAMSHGQQMLGSLLGNRADSVTSSIAGFSGISRTSATSLMALAVPIVMGAIGKLKAAEGLNATGLATLLTGQKSLISAALPAGLANVISPIDVQGVRSVTVAPIEEKSGGWMKWWPLLLVALALLGFLLWRGCSTPEAPTVSGPVMESVKLCSGETISLGKDSFNWSLARFLANGSDSELPKTFVFDNLNFDTDTTNLTPASRQTVTDLIAILKACPASQLQLAGHTDNTGDAAANQTLSERRAVAIKDLLVAGGVAADRLTTVGYGETKPIASNDTAEGKARNRRTELVVIKK